MPLIRDCASNGHSPPETLSIPAVLPTSFPMNPVQHIERWHKEYAAIRRDLHRHPELGFEEHRTAHVVCQQLAALGIEHHPGIGRTGVVAVVVGKSNESGR